MDRCSQLQRLAVIRKRRGLFKKTGQVNPIVWLDMSKTMSTHNLDVKKGTPYGNRDEW
jgi:hypothetical protein